MRTLFGAQQNLLSQLRNYSRFRLVSFALVVASMAILGPWVEWQITSRLIRGAAMQTTPLVQALLGPELRGLGREGRLADGQAERIERLLHETVAGKKIRALKVWNPDGRILFSTTPGMAGRAFPVDRKLQKALRGGFHAELSRLSEPENAGERPLANRLLEVYAPVRETDGGPVTTVIEYFLMIDDLEEEMDRARFWTWATFAASVLIAYAVIARLFRRADETIGQQSRALASNVAELTEALARNEVLAKRAQDAAAAMTTLNERILKRIGSELHDGPAQDQSLTLLRLDRVVERSEKCAGQHPDGTTCNMELGVIRSCLEHGLNELRAISSGLGVPGLAEMTLPVILKRAVRDHELRTGSKVQLELGDLPFEISLPAKIVVYRIVQEALKNAYTHAKGTLHEVRARCEGESLIVEVSDHGRGFDVEAVRDFMRTSGDRLGLLGMGDRVEGLGGTLTIESDPEHGTRLSARLSVSAGEAS